MDMRTTFNYAIIDETGYCYEVCTTSRYCHDLPGYIVIPVFNEEYIEKYYNVADGKWYLEETFTTEWVPA
jgi:hypothetical protein